MGGGAATEMFRAAQETNKHEFGGKLLISPMQVLKYSREGRW